MHITIIIILTYIACCLRVGAAPWKYFQLNARYFSKDQGIFSKLAIDALIPERWRLHQIPDDGMVSPERYPVFLKPEWGQNAHGIHRADNFQSLQLIRQSLKQKDGEQKYILQTQSTVSTTQTRATLILPAIFRKAISERLGNTWMMLASSPYHE